MKGDLEKLAELDVGGVWSLRYDERRMPKSWSRYVGVGLCINGASLGMNATIDSHSICKLDVDRVMVDVVDHNFEIFICTDEELILLRCRKDNEEIMHVEVNDGDEYLLVFDRI